MTRPIQLKSHSVLIDAPREMVYQKMTAFGRGRLQGDNNESSKVISRNDDTLVAEFKTKAGFFSYTTLEEITLGDGKRITFKHLKGPLAYAWEEFVLQRRRWQNGAAPQWGVHLEADPASRLAGRKALHQAGVRANHRETHAADQGHLRRPRRPKSRLPPQAAGTAGVVFRRSSSRCGCWGPGFRTGSRWVARQVRVPCFGSGSPATATLERTLPPGAVTIRQARANLERGRRF